LNKDDVKIAILGLGYVGLPLAIEFSKFLNVVGFDISSKRVEELKRGRDATREIDSSALIDTPNLFFTDCIDDLKTCNVFIITVPTPVDNNKRPNFEPLEYASRLVGSVMSKDAVVIYESTVYPGATEEICVPILEAVSSLNFNSDFYVGYSPERINPGDKTHRLPDIIKVTSGSTPQITKFVDSLYSLIITAGTFPVSSIMVAEAAKVIENTQRDINIALINELAMIFNRLDIDTEEVLLAAGSKWNFLSFRPGLVGGHCIGVDPYYLTYKAQSLGYNPEIILSGRRINDGMSQYVSIELLKAMLNKKIDVSNSKALILGFSFKENCPDVRNTKVIDIYHQLLDYGMGVDVFDPWVDESEATTLYDLSLTRELKNDTYSAIILAVAHSEFKDFGVAGITKLCKSSHVIYDLKSILPASDSTNILRL
jgi:UDP-N-acetyl-D-galactosamine dehydrogenase